MLRVPSSHWVAPELVWMFWRRKIFCPHPGIKPSIIQPTKRGNKTIYICVTLSIASMFSCQLIYDNELPNNMSMIWKVLAHQWMVLSAQKLFFQEISM